MDMGISYNSDIKKVKKIIQEEAMKHRLNIDNRTPEQIAAGEDRVMVRVTAWADSSINLQAWVWAKNPVDAFEMGCELYENIKYRFDEEGIEIPFPHRTLIMKKEN